MSNLKALLAVLLGALLFLAVVIWLGTLADRIGCHARWMRSGFDADYGILTGCRVSVDYGKTWIPEANYRKAD